MYCREEGKPQSLKTYYSSWAKLDMYQYVFEILLLKVSLCLFLNRSFQDVCQKTTSRWWLFRFRNPLKFRTHRLRSNKMVSGDQKLSWRPRMYNSRNLIYPTSENTACGTLVVFKFMTFSTVCFTPNSVGQFMALSLYG